MNLRIALQTLDGVPVRPGRTFSFWRLVGDTKKGYLPGMELWANGARSDIGGGVCQFANLLY